MAKILLTHAYLLRLDQKQWQNGLPFPPLGTLFAAALLRSLGHEVHFTDMMFARRPQDIGPALQPDAFFVIYDDGFNYLTKMCLTNMRHAALEMIRLAKQKNCTVIVSSSDATDHAEKYLAAGADFVLTGEAEQTLAELVNALENKTGDLSAVRGIHFLQNSQAVKTRPRLVMKDLDALPLPAWDLVDMEPYRESWRR